MHRSDRNLITPPINSTLVSAAFINVSEDARNDKMSCTRYETGLTIIGERNTHVTSAIASNSSKRVIHSTQDKVVLSIFKTTGMGESGETQRPKHATDKMVRNRIQFLGSKRQLTEINRPDFTKIPRGLENTSRNSGSLQRED